MNVYKSNRIERLLEALAEVVRTPAGGPFQPETVVVHSPGVGRWLAAELARSLGICAGVRFPQPDEVVREALVAALPEQAAALDAWAPERLRWAVLRLLPEMIELEPFAPLEAYLRQEGLTGAKAGQLAGRIAETFERYLVYRPGMIRSWIDGEGQGWQPPLLRALAQRLEVPTFSELSHQFARACLRPELDLGRFPRRLSLFGITTLPPASLELLVALSRHVEIHLFVNSPTSEYWADLRTQSQVARQRVAGGEAALELEDLHFQVGHPLLASFGRLGRDFQLLLEEGAEAVEPRPDLYVDPAEAALGAGRRPTLLEIVQSDVLNLVDRGAEGQAEPAPIAVDDRSITIHGCHGPMRQVEVLQDELLELFRTVDELEPRDVVVMTPDLETYAPLVSAVFDQPRSDPRALPFRIADQPLRQRSPVAEALLRVLDLAGSRVTAPEVLDLIALEPIHQRFGIAVEDLEQIIDWVSAAGIRWGIDGEHRRRHGQPAYRENSWRFGLDRLLLGYVMPGDGRWTFGEALPYDEIEGGAAVLLGRLVELCETLFRLLEQLEGGPRTLSGWRELLSTVLAELVASTPGSAWEHDGLRERLASMEREAETVGYEGLLELDAVRELLEAELDEIDERSGFASGRLTFCSIVPLRNVPFRVVALLGMDDAVFPRSPSAAGFDLLERQGQPGDRNDRDDDRQAYLEALLAALDRVVITYSGRSVRDNSALPPSVAVAELIDVISAAVRIDGAEGDDDQQQQAVRDHLTVQHPLHPFSPRNFGADPDERLYTFAEGYLAGARALLAERSSEPPFISGPLSPSEQESTSLTLSTLVRFFEHPARALLERRLGLRLFTDELSLPDREPIELNALDRFLIAQPLLERRIVGEDLSLSYRSVRAAGVLPWGTPGRCLYGELVQSVEPVARAVLALRDQDRREPLPIELALGDGGELRLTGRLDGLYPRGQVIYRFGRPRARDMLRLWIRHLALCCQEGGEGQSFFVARAGGSGGAAVFELDAPEEPEALLEQLIHLALEGLHQPLLFFPETSWSYADALADSGDPGDPEAQKRALAAARRAWEGVWWGGRPGEGADLALQRIFGGAQPFWSHYRPRGFDLPPERTFHHLALQVCRPLRDHLREVSS